MIKMRHPLVLIVISLGYAVFDQLMLSAVFLSAGWILLAIAEGQVNEHRMKMRIIRSLEEEAQQRAKESSHG